MSRNITFTGVSAFVAIMAIAMAPTAAETEQGKTLADAPGFVMHRVGTFRSEACGVGDFNNDGKLDIVAGPYLYLAPDWKPLKIRELKGNVDEKGIGYYQDFMNLPLDVDGDGRLDVVSCSWDDKNCTWYRNPGTEGEPWRELLIEQNNNFEGGDLWDIDGDGKSLELVTNGRHTEWCELGKLDDGKQGVIRHVISERRPAHFGSGAGDINGDGRIDVIRPDAWYEAPADPREGNWREHPMSLGGKDGATADTAQIFVYDVNRDGRNDILCGCAHNYGVFWYEQVCDGDNNITWKQHVIDDTWSQSHAMMLADLDGNGIPEIVTGKRFMAHCGNDPGEYEPLGIYRYELQPGANPGWTKHVISHDEGVGSGANVDAQDMDADGDLDIVTTGKYGGLVWFENQLRKNIHE